MIPLDREKTQYKNNVAHHDAAVCQYCSEPRTARRPNLPVRRLRQKRAEAQ
jgi:hypothetical protein